MTLTDPHEALADRSDFIGYLVGLAALADMVRALAADNGRAAHPARGDDDFVHVLLGLASTGSAVARMATCAPALLDSTTADPRHPTRLLR
jgi:hypothetical protein